MNENGIVVQYGSDEQDYYTDVLAPKAKDYVLNVAGDSSPFFNRRPYASPCPNAIPEYPPSRP